jgi:hypothetical protein
MKVDRFGGGLAVRHDRLGSMPVRTGRWFQTGFAEWGFSFQLFFSLINDDECGSEGMPKKLDTLVNQRNFDLGLQ